MSIFKIIILFNIMLFLMSCGTVKEGFTNQKKKSTDEFLVEKKSPLVMPPDFDELPIPKEQEEKLDTKENEFKTLISKENVENKPDNNKNINKSFEESLLEKIKNN
tara:strand:- start:786 stop:1103 length:318 start_codon:yes stop_codon:yes gene_type:complete